MVNIEAVGRFPWTIQDRKTSVPRQEFNDTTSPEVELFQQQRSHRVDALLLNYLHHVDHLEVSKFTPEGELRKLNRLKPLKRARLRLARIDVLERGHEDGFDTTSYLKELVDQARADLQKAATYKSIKQEEKEEYYQLLVDTVRRDPEMTWGESTKWLMSLRGVGLEATMAILEDFSRYSWEGKDISYERRKRLAEKKMEVQKKRQADLNGLPAPTQKDWSDEDRRIVEENANIVEPSFGFNGVLAEFERNRYQELASFLSPATIAQMIDPNLTDREFRLGYKYKDICEMLKNLLASTGNPY